MKKFTKHILLLALMLFGVAGAAWALPRAPQKFTGPVDIATLVQGDTLSQGFSLICNGESKLRFPEGTVKINGSPREWDLYLDCSLINNLTYGSNGAMLVGSDAVTPAYGDWQDGNAWVVTDAYFEEYYRVTLGGITIDLAPDPTVPALDETTGNWNFLMPGSNKVVNVQLLDSIVVGPHVTVGGLPVEGKYANGTDTVYYYDTNSHSSLTLTAADNDGQGRNFGYWADLDPTDSSYSRRSRYIGSHFTCGDTFRAVYLENHTLTLDTPQGGGTLTLDGYTPASVDGWTINVSNIGATSGEDAPNTSQYRITSVSLLAADNSVVGSANLNAASGTIQIDASATAAKVRFNYSWYNSEDEETYGGTIVSSLNAVSGQERHGDEGDDMLTVTVNYTSTPNLTPAVTPFGISANNNGSFNVMEGLTVNVTATPDSAHYLAHIGSTDTVSNYACGYSFVMPSNDYPLLADFQAKPTLTLDQTDGGTLEAIVPQAEPVLLTTIIPTETAISTGTQTNDTVTVTVAGELEWGGDGWIAQYENGKHGSVSVTAAAGFDIAYCKFYLSFGGSYIDSVAPYAVYPYSESGPVVYSQPNGQGQYLGSGSVSRIEVYTTVAPNVIASSTPNTYYIDYGTPVTVKATPSDTAYLVRFDQDADTNSNVAVEKTYDSVVADIYLQATFQAKPQLILTHNDGGTLTLDGMTTRDSALYNFVIYGETQNITAYPHQKVINFWDNVSSVFGGNDTVSIAQTGQKQVTVTVNRGFSGNITVGAEVVLEDEGGALSPQYIPVVGTPAGSIHDVELPAGVVSANATADTFVVDYGTTLTVKATPSDTAYLVRFDQDADTNSNVAVEKTYGPLTAALTTAEATFNDKPVLTLAKNESWGSVSVSGPVVWNNQIWGSWNYFTSFPQTIGDITINKNNFYCYYNSGKLLLSRSVDNNSHVTFTSAGDNFTRIEMTYTGGSNLEPANEWTCENGVAVWEGDAQSVTITNANNFYFTQIKFIRGSGVTQLTDNTYRVDYGTEVSLIADATELHHVAGWQNEDGNAMDTAAYSNYAIYAAPDSLFPAKSSLTFTVTGDTTAMAMFGINSYDLTAQVAETDDLRGTVSFDYTDVEGNAQATGDTSAMTVTAQGGSQTTVTATPATGYHFVGWMDNLNTQSNLNTQNPLTVTDAGSYTAVFDTNEYQLTVALCDECTGRGTVTGTQVVKHFLNYEISVTPDVPYYFTDWSDGSTEPVRTVSLVSDSTITATLLPKKILTFAHNEGGQMEFIVPQDVTTFEGIATTSVSQNGITVTAANADADGMYLRNGESINISIAGEVSITQVDFHVTNGTNLVNTIGVDAQGATITTTNNNQYGSIKGLNTPSLTISSSTTHDLQIDQLTVHYGRTLPNGVAYSDVDSIFYVMPDTTVIVRAIPDEGHYLVSWSDNAQVIDTLSASITMAQDETLTATFAPNPVLTLAVSDEAMGTAYFTGYHGNTITRAGIIKAESVDLPYQWYEASEIMSIEGGNGMVTKDANSHYVIVSGVFDGTATVITSTGAFNVTCEPTLPNGVHYNIAEDNYTVMPYTVLSLTATTLADNYYFVDWAKVTLNDTLGVDSVLISTEAVTTVRIDKDMKLQGNFLHNPYVLTLAALPDSMGIVTEISRLPYTLPDTLIKQGWEDGMNGWTMNHCDGTTGIYSDFATHSGNNIFLFNYTTNYPQYLISPELDISDGGTISFWYQAYSSGYTERFQVGYSTTTNDPSAFTFGEEVSTNQTNYLYYENTFPAGTKYLCISCNSNDQYYLFLDDLTITTNTLVAGSKAVVPDTTTPNTYLVMADSTVTIVANANTGYHITGWSNNAEVNSLTSDTIQVTMVSDTTLSATFGVNPVVTLAANGNGTVAAGTLPAFAIDNQDGTYSVLPGTAFTFVAKPDPHYYMTRWDDIDSMVNSNTVVSRTETIDGDTAFSATFAHKPVLTLASNDTAFGTVTIDGSGPVGVDNMFDNLVDVIAASSGYQYGVVSDGQYIYTSSWSTSIDDGYIFHQYDQAGNLIDYFNIDGVVICRDMTYDGQYIYGVNGETVYVMDLAAHTLVNTIQFSGAGTVRHISYDPVRDAFWVGNWNSLMLYSRTGSFIQNGPGVSSVSGTAFYQDDEDHLILLCQPDGNAVVYDYNINQGTITQLIDITSAVGVDGSSGGSFIGNVNGTIYWLGDSQGEPNEISVYSLGKGGVYALNDTTFIVDYNNNLTMRAAAKTGYEFLNWEGANGENLGTADSLTVTMTMDTLVHAIFDTLHYQLTVNVADANTGFGTVEGSRTATHFIEYEISATAEEGYHFVMWTDSVTANPRTVTLTSDSTFTASFDTNTYVLTVVSADTVMGTVSGSDSAAKHFVNYDIIATPNYGYHFVNWSNESLQDTTTVTLTSDSTFTATFGYNQYTVTGQPATTTDLRGTVSGSATVNYLDTVTLVATANTGYHFTKWVNAANAELGTSDTLMVQALRDSTVYAVFDTNEYQLTVVVADTCQGRGTVAQDTVAKHFLNYEISATANPGYHFVAWNDGVTDATRMVSLVSDSTIAAIFDYNPALTLVYNEQNGHVEFIVDNQVANFTGIAGTSLTADGLTVTAQSADDMGMSIKDNQTITIVADSGIIINQVAFHLTNGTNKASLINATAGTVNAANGNAYGAVTDVHNDTVVISSTSDKSINIDQLTIQYAPIMPAGVVRLESDNHDVYRVDYNTTVSLLAVPADSSYLESWAGDTTSTDDLVAVVTIDSSDATVYANFHGNPILTLAANGNGRVYFEGYSGYTVNRDETVLVTNITDFPYMWYEAGEISEITGGNGMVYADQTNHYVNVDGAFNGTATVVTTSGAFTVTCIPTVPNGITIMSLDTFLVAPGTEVTVRGEAEAEHYLVNWNDLDSAATVRTVTVNYNTDLVANFLHFPYTLAVNVDTVMGSAAPAEGQTYVTLNADGTYTVMADSAVTLVATADSGYHFVNWTDANNSAVSTDASIEFTMVGDTAFTAVFDTNVYILSVVVADAQSHMGTVAGTDSTAKHFLSYNISATPNAGFRFMGWSDGDTNASRTISLTQDSTLTATFDTIHAELAWSADAFTGYTMIDFNSYKPTLSNPNNVEVRYGVVESGLTIDAANGTVGTPVAYGNIANATGTYTIYAVHDLTNEFFYDSVAYTLTVEQGVIVNISQNNDEGGSALFADRDSLPTLTHHYASGIMAFVAHDTTVDVVAEAAEGFHFTAWQEGNLVNGYSDIATTTEYTYTVPNATAAGLKAVFDTNVYNMNIAVAAANTGMGTVTGPATVKHFLSGEFIATAETGYHFTGWKNEAGNVVSMLDTLVVEPVSDTTLYATFDTNTYTLTVVVANGQNDWGTVEGSQTVKHFLDYDISATPATCYHFVAWDDNDSNASRTVTLTSDSTITAEFAYTVRAHYDTLVVCDTATWNDSIYLVSGDYSKALKTAENCDSTANLHLTVKNSTESMTTVTECESYKWHDITYTMSTLAHFDTINAVGCDSIANLDLTIHYNTVGEETVVTCDSVYRWNNIIYVSSTIGTWNGTNVYGCDSTATLHLTLNNNFTGTDVQQHCTSYTWIDGVTYTASTNTPTYVFQMANGCDSTVTLDLTISNVAASTQTVTACDSYTWIDGVTYTASTNTPTYTSSTNAGCDSVVTLNLTINQSAETNDTVNACNYYIWDGVYYTNSNTYTKHYSTALGCDSTVNLTLTINQPVSNTISESACGSYTWNNIEYTASGAYTQTFTVDNGCDSTVTLTLTVKQPTNAIVNVTAGSSYEWNGTTYTASGSYTYTTTGSNGCDSTTTLQLTVTDAVNGSMTMTACDSYTWNGTEYTVSGDYTYSHLDNYGNTQVDTLHLTINNSVEHAFSASACNYYIWDGTFYNETGSYTKHYTAANGCDSAATLTLTVNQPVTVALSETACGSYTWNGTNYTASGAYTQSFTGSNGCDSTVTLTLTVNQPTAATVVASACDSYTWSNGNGETYTQSGNYTYTTTGSNGCDSVTTLQLTVLTTGTSVDNVTACDSYTWIDGVTYTESTNTPTHPVNEGACNTVVTLNLTINSSVSTAVSETACESYTWNGVTYNASGSYSQTFTAANDCDSTVTLTLTVNNSLTAAETATACDSYVWNGQTYTTTGVYTYTTTGSNNCDSTVTLTLTVKQPVAATVTASACDSYTWNGTNYTTTGNYTYTTTGSNGCDSVTTLQLTVNNATTGIETIEACDSYTWHGTNYTASNNTATYTTTNAAGCDSTVTLNLTIKESFETSIADAACNYYIWDGTYYNVSGSYTKNYTAANGCDSVVTLALTINQPVTASISESACGSYTWNGVEYTASGAYSRTLTGSNGCDSTVTLTLTVKQPVNVTVTASACDSYAWNGQNYTTSGNYTYTTTAANGCDSVTTLQLTVRNATTGTETVTACDSYTWHGTTYTASNNTATYTTTNAAGCDSVITLNLTVEESVAETIAETVCESYTWNNVNYTTSGSYTQTFTAGNGCDSTVTLNLTLNQPVANTVTASACDSYEWHGVTYTETPAVAPTYTTTGSNGCDSVTTLNLVIAHTGTSVDNVTACDSYTWIDGQTYTASTNEPTYTITGENCNTIVTLNLTINNSVETSFDTAACNYYIWDGNYYNNSGSYTKSYRAANGCDSVVTMALTVNHPVSSRISETVCGSYTWNSVDYTVSGVYTQVFTGSNGCDSTVTLALTVNQPRTTVLTATACDSYTWHGVTYTATGSYTFDTIGSNGCDSTATLQLTINRSTTATETVTACDSYTWHGVTYTASGSYDYTTTGANGCDMVTTLNLTVNESATGAVDTTVCGNYIWAGTYYTASGVYNKTYAAANGCDSVVTLTLTVNQPVTSSFSESACQSYTWNNVEYAASGVYTQTFNGSNGCDSVVTLTLNIKQPVTVTVSQTACDSYTWNGQTYTASGSYSYTTTGSNGCDSTTVLQLTVNQSTTATETVTACDSYTWHGVTYTASTNTPTFTTTGANGCDLVTTLNLTVNSSVADNVSATACNYYIWDGSYYANSGVYVKSYTALNGCDSVVTMTLTVNQPTTATVNQTACDSYTWNGQTYYTSGNYSYTTTGSNGCDSTTTLHLTVNQSTTAIETVSACGSYTWIDGVTYTASTNTPTFTTTGANGCNLVTTLHLTINNPVHTAETMAACESYTWNGTAYNASGDYTYSHNDANGCVQVDTLHLTINNPVHTAETMVACGSYIWHGTSYVVTGDYTFSHADVNGCTQVDTLHLTVGNSVVVNETVTTCDSYEWNGRVYTENGEYTYNTTTVNGCDSTVILHLTVNHSATSSFDTLAYGSFTWNGQTYTESGAYEQTLTTVNGCDSVVTLNLVILPEGFVMPYLYNLMDVMLSVNHNEDGAENVRYIWYRWYRNGELVLEGPNYDSYSENGNRLNGCYYLEVAVDESMQYWVRSNEVCINGVGIEDVENVEITLAPNPVRQGSMVKVSANGADLQGAELRVFDLQGRMLLEQKDNTVFMAPSATGMYMVRLTLSDGRKVVSKLIVK